MDTGGGEKQTSSAARWETWEGGEEREAGEEVEQLLPRHHALAAGDRRSAPAGRRRHGSFFFPSLSYLVRLVVLVILDRLWTCVL